MGLSISLLQYHHQSSKDILYVAIDLSLIYPTKYKRGLISILHKKKPHLGKYLILNILCNSENVFWRILQPRFASRAMLNIWKSLKLIPPIWTLITYLILSNGFSFSLPLPPIKSSHQSFNLITQPFGKLEITHSVG